MTPEEKTAKVEKIRKRCLISAAFWLCVFGVILDEFRKLVTPKLNIYQIRLCQAFEWARQQGIPVRIIGLKPRQVGGTTMAAAIIYWFCRTKPINVILIADIFARSQKLFTIFLRFAQLDRMNWGFGFTSTAKEINFENKSRAEMKTAENPAGSRADTIQGLLASELPFWPQDGEKSAEETLVALEGSLADHPDTVEIIESTPKGAFGIFPQRFQNAKWPVYDDYWKRYVCNMPSGSGDSIMIRVFAGWYEFEKHRMKVGDDDIAAIQLSLTKREKRGIERYQWTFDQIAWRRWAIANKCSGSELKFDEEYPEDPQSCFTASGSPRFNQEALNYLEEVARATQWRTGVLMDPIRAGAGTSFMPTAENECWLRVLEEPRRGLRYIIVGDVSSDRDVSPGSSQQSERDKHSFGVFRAAYTDHRGIFYRKKLVARLHYPCEDGHDVLSKKIWLLWLYYGKPPVAPEMNNHGLSLANKLRALGVTLLSRELIDPKTGSTRTIYGWETNQQTRPEIIDSLASAIRDVKDAKTTGIEVFDMHSINEFRTFQIGRDGKAQAATGAHDDDVMMLAIGNFLLPMATIYAEDAPIDTMPNDGYREISEENKADSIMPLI